MMVFMLLMKIYQHLQLHASDTSGLHKLGYAGHCSFNEPASALY